MANPASGSAPSGMIWKRELYDYYKAKADVLSFENDYREVLAQIKKDKAETEQKTEINDKRLDQFVTYGQKAEK